MQGVIYILTNKQNGMVYIGQTDNLKRRMQRHLAAARNKNTRNEGQPIVHAIREFGIEAFDCSVLETITAETKSELRNLLDEREKFYIAEYNATENGYNVTLGGRGMLGYEPSKEAVEAVRKAKIGCKLSEEHKDAVRKATIRRWQDEDFRQLMSERMSGENNPMYGVRLTGERNHNFGKPMAEETKRKLSAAKMGHPGHPLSDETKEKLIIAAKRPKSETHKRKLSESLIGKSNPLKMNPIIQYDKEGYIIKEWESLEAAQRAFKTRGIGKCVSGKNKTAKGFVWRYKGDSFDSPTFKPTKRVVIQMDLDGNEFNRFSTIREASEKLNIYREAISAVIKGKRKEIYGYIFKFI